MTKRTIPAISIVIPMYNAEKYVGECLDSILAQTFEDYEVIVVDDCSTDNSASIVESYIPKFNKNGIDRLRLIRLQTNSGAAAKPRNVGIRFAVGEYLMFIDSDDAITETALEELYSIAEKFNADVVRCDKFYIPIKEDFSTNKSSLKEHIFKVTDFVDAPTLMSDNPIKRIMYMSSDKLDWSTYTIFVRRELVVNNNLEFIDVKIYEDMLFTFYLLSLAKNIVRIPNIFYIYRRRNDSLCSWGKTFPFDIAINRWGYSGLKVIEATEEFMNKTDCFKGHPECKYAVYDFILRNLNDNIIKFYMQIPAYKLDSLLRVELDKISNKTALTAFLFSRMNIFNVNIIRQQQIIQRQQQQIQQLQAQVQQLQKPQSQKFHLNADDIFK